MCEAACTDPSVDLGMAFATCEPSHVCDQNNHFFDPTLCNNCATEIDPLLPTASTGTSFTFYQDAGMVCANDNNSPVFWIDPPVSTGYNYSISGTYFLKVQMPTTVPDPDGFKLEYEENGGTIVRNMANGEEFEFPTPVAAFSIKDINPELTVDPDSPTAFPTGIAVAKPQGPGITITQEAIVGYYNNPPIADAGPDQTGQAPHTFNLDGSGSSDPDGDPLTYHWTHVSGPSVPLTNSQTATPYTYAMNVTAPTTVVLELKVEDSYGEMSAPDQVELTMMPPANMAQCTPWNRDRLVEAINFYPEGGGYSVTQDISGQIETDLQNWVNDIPGPYPDFGKFEIKSYVSNVGTGVTPQLIGQQMPPMPPSSRNFTVPASPAPAPYWTGGHFEANTWYRLDTKINVYRASNGYVYDDLVLTDSYDDDCVYQTVYFKIDAQGNLQARQSKGGIRRTPLPLRTKMIFSDGTQAIGGTKYPQRPKPRDLQNPRDFKPVGRPLGRPTKPPVRGR